MYFTFNQNNSGGTFIGSQYVCIEADTLDEACSIGETVGLYFDGEGDCECCGNRWSRYAHESNSPQVYGEPLRAHKNQWRCDLWEIHHKDGTVERSNTEVLAVEVAPTEPTEATTQTEAEVLDVEAHMWLL